MKTSETVLNALVEPVLLLDDKMRVVLANPAFCGMLKITSKQLQGKTILEIVSDEDSAQQLTNILRPVAEGHGEVRGVEVVCFLQDRTRITVSVNARAVAVEQDTLPLLLVEFQDSTKEKTYDKHIEHLNQSLKDHITKLELTNKELESFSHSVSHDLRTPLRLMNKVAHLLIHDHGENISEDAIQMINMIITSTQEMERLIGVLLLFSQAIRAPIKRKPVNLNRLLGDVIRKLKGEYSGRSVEFEIENLPPCNVDRDLFREVFLNLVANAIKFTRIREHARIQIGSMEAAGETVYFVRDNGVGLDENKAPYLFEAFKRLHSKDEYEGAGIGLALVKRIVERHGGCVWCESKINEGSTFYFTVNDPTVDA